MEKLLVANRGEIARRIFRTCRKLGVRTVAVYTSSERFALHVIEADEAYCIGDSPQAYLDPDAILEAAREADALHPGYGFLSESASFAEQVQGAGIQFVGPPPPVMRLLGDKNSARQLARSCGVPILEGYDGEDQDDVHLQSQAQRIGFPLLIKAVGGGGGRGIRLVRQSDEFDTALAAARREASQGFADSRLILEQFVERARHLEVQLIGDTLGEVAHLFERECSVQRRYQKVIEEAPAAHFNRRADILRAALELGRAAGITHAVTVEFLVPYPDEGFYFLEANCRLQVEHPVTEMITGLDLVEIQLRISCGERLDALLPDELTARGHAIEARLYAETSRGTPAEGRLRLVILPAERVRLDHALQPGMAVSTSFDPMLAKIIAGGVDRNDALRSLQAALHDTSVLGVSTNLTLLRQAVGAPQFAAGPVATSFLHTLSYPEPADGDFIRALIGSLAIVADENSPRGGFTIGDYFRATTTSSRTVLCEPPLEYLVASVEGESMTFRARRMGKEGTTLAMEVDGTTYRCALLPREKARATLTIDGMHCSFLFVREPEAFLACWIECDGMQFHVRRQLLTERHTLIRSASTVDASLPGKILRYTVAPGESVATGQPVVLLESMKMEHVIEADRDGVVEEILCQSGDTVRVGMPLLRFRSAPPSSASTPAEPDK